MEQEVEMLNILVLASFASSYRMDFNCRILVIRQMPDGLDSSENIQSSKSYAFHVYSHCLNPKNDKTTEKFLAASPLKHVWGL